MSDAFFSGSKCEEVSQALILEVGMVKGPKRGVGIKVTAHWDSKARVTKMRGHCVDSGRGQGVRTKGVGIEGDIDRQDGASGSGVKGGEDGSERRRKSIY